MAGFTIEKVYSPVGRGSPTAISEAMQQNCIQAITELHLQT
jgi:hypothetical protein